MIESDIIFIKEQGGSVMCVFKYGSEPAHPQFWYNCLPNEENRKPPNIQLFFKKMVYEQKIASKANNSDELKFAH